VDERNAWFGLLRTTDGGRTWQRLSPAEKADLKWAVPTSPRGTETLFVSAARGWLVSATGLWQTEDGGHSWLRIADGDWASFGFADARHGWLYLADSSSDDAYQLFRSADGGITWTPCAEPADGPEPPYRNHFLDEKRAFGINTSSVGEVKRYGVVRTTDGGCTWEQVWIGTEFQAEVFGEIHFVDGQHGWLAGRKFGTLLETADGGRSWSVIPLPGDNIWVLSAHMVGPGQGWLLGFDRDLKERYRSAYHTVDGGIHWRKLPLSEFLQGVGDNPKKNLLPADWKGGRRYQICLYSQMQGHLESPR
jgi:photosystem II stability/assembly factor-like uncharacterized protein